MLVGCLCADSDFFSDSGSGWEQFSINSPLSFIRSKASSCIFSHAFALRWWDSLSPKRVGRAFGRSDQSLRGHSDHDDKTQGWSCLHSSQSWLLVFICVHMIFFFYTNGIILNETDMLPTVLMRHLWYHTICAVLQVVFSLNYLFRGLFPYWFL